MSESFAILKSHPNLITYVDGLQRKNAEALSFYPRCTFERESAKGRVFLGLLNGEPCGYMYVGAGKDGNLRCHQVCIQYDARRRLYGASLVVAMEDYAKTLGCSLVTLRCGFDLEANEFWRSLGYSCTSTVDGGIRRLRKINIWQKSLDGELQLIAIEPATGKTDASLWRKHKTTGLVTQFNRGKILDDYRAVVIADSLKLIEEP